VILDEDVKKVQKLMNQQITSFSSDCDKEFEREGCKPRPVRLISDKLGALFGMDHLLSEDTDNEFLNNIEGTRKFKVANRNVMESTNFDLDLGLCQ
jgi:hypothetical protein